MKEARNKRPIEYSILVNFVDEYRSNPILKIEIKEYYPEVYSAYQTLYENGKGGFKQFLRDFDLLDIYWNKRTKSGEDYLKEIKEEADKIIKEKGAIPKFITKDKETMKLYRLIRNYAKTTNLKISGTSGYVDFLKGLGYKIEKTTVKDFIEYLEEKNISKQYYSVDIMPYYRKLKKFEEELGVPLEKLMLDAGYTFQPKRGL